MPYKKFTSVLLNAALGVLLTSALTGCKDKAKLQRKLEEVGPVISEKQQTLAELQKTYAATPVISKTTSTRPNDLFALATEIKQVEGEIANLKTRKAEAEKAMEEERKRINDYRAKYARP